MLLASLQRGISFLILPFVSHAMSPVEFGAASTLTATALFVTAVVGAPLIQLIIRAAARGEEDGPALLRIIGIYCYYLLPIAVALLAAAVALFMPPVLGVSGPIWAIELLAIGLQPAASVYALWVAQAREDLARFAWLSSMSVLATAASKLLLVVLLEMGVLGWVLSDLISAILSGILALLLVRVPRARVTREHARSVLKFTLPLVPHTASIWAVTSLSRPAMAAVSSLDQVGLLAFGTNLASVAGLVMAETNRAVLPRYSRESFPAPSQETLMPVRWQLVTAFVVPAVIGTGIAVIGPLIFADAYWPSFALTGILLVGQAAYGIYLIPMNFLTQSAGLPKYSPIASGAGALLILVLILLLGHRYGAAGVAYITFAGYLTMMFLAMILVRLTRLNIAWNSWLRDWPAVLMGVLALAAGVLALSSPVGSNLVSAWAAISLASSIGAVILAARGSNPRPTSV
jgi:O-antigen/teichoic acid export membrane protein